MTVSGALKYISSIGHVTFPAPSGGEGTGQVEVYSGSVFLDRQDHHGPIVRDQYQVFLPIEGSTIQFYNHSTILESSVMVAPTGFAGDDDEANYCAVEDYAVILENESLPGVGGNPLCLVLLFSIAIQNGNLQRVSYNVTVKMKAPVSLNDRHDVGPDAAPRP